MRCVQRKNNAMLQAPQIAFTLLIVFRLFEFDSERVVVHWFSVWKRNLAGGRKSHEVLKSESSATFRGRWKRVTQKGNQSKKSF
ncbi:hypothetical protein QVD17_34519 [Tagetes erecta]|uniref:Uncharacterized protein n=1 Tax=Tagetes erecta TaxID=13708 RepID=A0AAD8K4G0_TARER|nr:hypothetical protein QVD17_34519 [Tagetes erecta]